MTTGPRAPAIPALYTLFYPLLVKLGQEVGWVFTVHGSMTRDMDVVAAPWHTHAIPEEDLVKEVAKRLGANPLDPRIRRTVKPHGRVAVLIPLGHGATLDLSVLPRSDPRA